MIKVLYIFVRYCTYIDVILNLFEMIVKLLYRWYNATFEFTCKIIYQANIWLMMIGIAASDLILNLRVWAVWRKTRTMAIILITLNIGFLTPVCVTWGLFANTLTCAYHRKNTALGIGCASVTAWAVLLTYQTGSMLILD
ncbi:hypothetical protein BDQ17DRAFT_1357991, partial [Cyathus striatus]